MVLTYMLRPKEYYARKNNFYGSTQSRLITYTKDRRVEEQNGDIQQAKVYQKLAEDRGDIETADRLAKLGTMVINKFGQQVQAHAVPSTQPITELPFDIRNYIGKAIQNGTLSNIWDAIKKIPKNKLSKKARIIQGDIKHDQTLKSIVNEKVMTYDMKMKALGEENRSKLVQSTIKKYNEKIARGNVEDIISIALNPELDDIIQTIVGSKENESALEELLQTAESINANVAKQLSAQNAKFGSTTSVGSQDETQMSKGDIPIVNTSKNPVKYNTVEEYVNAKKADSNFKTNAQWSSSISYLVKTFKITRDKAIEHLPQTILHK